MSRFWLPKGRLSISQMKKFDTCQRLYFFDYISDRPEEIIPQLVAGGGCHAALEWAYGEKKSGRNPGHVDVYNQFLTFWNARQHTITNWANWKGFVRPKAEYLDISKVYLINHMNLIYPKYQPLHLEREIRVAFDDVDLLGYVDMEVDGGILDHKFRYGMGKPKLDPATDDQLTFYSYATKNPKVGFIFHWLEKRGNMVVPKIGEFFGQRNEADYRKLHTKVISVASKIDRCKRDGDFPKVHRKKCPVFCPFLKKCWGSEEKATDKFVYDTLAAIPERPTLPRGLASSGFGTLPSFGNKAMSNVELPF